MDFRASKDHWSRNELCRSLIKGAVRFEFHQRVPAVSKLHLPLIKANFAWQSFYHGDLVSLDHQTIKIDSLARLQSHDVPNDKLFLIYRLVVHEPPEHLVLV